MRDGTWKDGLEDVIAARSAICRVDGAAGRLYYRGYEIGELAGRGELRGHDAPALVRRAAVARAERAAFAARLARGPRRCPAPVLALLRALPRDCHPLDALRTAVSLAAAARSGRARRTSRTRTCARPSG